MAQKITASGKEPALSQDSSEPTRMRPVFRPRADIFETDHGIVLYLEMPGVAQDGLEVTLERRILTIRGRTLNDRHHGYRQIYAEYQVGDFERAFTLSEAIDPDRIDARHQDGVLTVTLPRAEPAKAKRIEVRTH